MSPVVAVCPVHGPYASKAFVAIRSTNITFKDNVEFCPTCHRPARVMDGTFDFDAHGIATALAAPAWSIDALRAIQEPLRLATTVLSNPETSDEQAQRIAERVVEMLAKRDEAAAKQVGEKVRGKPKLVVATVLLVMLDAIGHVVDLHDAGELAADYGTAIVEAFENSKEAKE